MALAASSVLALGMIAVAPFAAAPAQADQIGQMPVFQSGDGITVVSQTDAGREIDLQVTTTAVSGTHEIIVLLPTTYTDNTTTRYPTLYLLNGALADPTQWVSAGGAANQITEPYQSIIVMPDGGVKGWYLNWASCSTICPQNWETFHNQQVVPWIDANLRTIADRSGRAVGGLSMGGFGSVHYAEDYPSLYSDVASFSGALDTGNFTTESAIYGEEVGVVPGSGTPVPPGSIMGEEFAPFNTEALAIADVNPTNIAKLAGTTVQLYVGTGDASSGDGIVESAVKPQNDLMASRMAAAGINYWYSQDHVNSADLGWGCDNNHDIMCWNAYLASAMPRIMGTLAAATPTPPAVPPPPPGNVVVDGGFESAGMGPWTCIGGCGVDQDLGNAYSGNNNGWVRNANTGNWNDIQQTVPVAPNSNYTLTGWIRTSSNNDAGYFGVRDTNGNVIDEQEFNSLPGYTEITVQVYTGNNTTVQVYGGLWPNNGDTWMQIDDVSLAPS